VKLAAVVATVAVAVLLQLALARYMVGGRWLFDVVLVGVVYAALSWGPVAGMLTGTVGGLIQDALSNDVVGVGGLAKTLVGFVTGLVGAQFVVARPIARVAILAGASVVHRMLLIGFHALIDQHWPVLPGAAILAETLANSAFGLIAFQGSEKVAGAVSRGSRNRRSGLKRREW
jgi:rod shape-determining protein MreD